MRNFRKKQSKQDKKKEPLQKALKVFLKPNEEQKVLLNKTLGSCRFLYNKMLNERIENYKTYKESQKEDLRQLYKMPYKTEKDWKEQFEWLNEADSTALQQTRLNLINAYDNFFKSLKGVRKGEPVGFPKFKCKHNHKDSYRTVMGIDVNFEENKLKLIKLGWMNFSLNIKKFKKKKPWYFDPEVKIKSVTVRRTPTNKYFASILFEGRDDRKPLPKSYDENIKIIGLDMSLQSFYVDAENNSPEFQRNYRMFEDKLAKRQRSLSRKTKGSVNYEKQRVKVAEVHERIANKRKDFNHKLSLQLVKENDVIVLETLNLKAMSQCLNLGKSVMDLGYGDFTSKLLYKADWMGKHIIKAERFFASSKLCSVCGYKNKKLLLHEREWTCPVCGSHHLRNQNSGQNLEDYGINWLRGLGLMPVEKQMLEVCGSGSIHTVTCESPALKGGCSSKPLKRMNMKSVM